MVPGDEGPARRRIAKLVPSQEPLELGLRGVNRDHVEAAAVVRAVLGGGLGRVDLQQDELASTSARRICVGTKKSPRVHVHGKNPFSYRYSIDYPTLLRNLV